MAMAEVLKGMSGKPPKWIDPTVNCRITVHGFRSSFRDWAAETTSFPHEACEMALAHVVGDKVEAAYRRGDMFDKRRALAAAWAKYCGQIGVKKSFSRQIVD